MKLIKEDLRVWDQESIDNQNALASIAKELRNILLDNGIYHDQYGEILYDIFDYGNEIHITNVNDIEAVGDAIESDLGFPFRIENGYDIVIDTTQEYEDEYGDIQTRVSREYLEENIKFSDEPEVEYKGYIISPFTLKDIKVGDKNIGDCTKYSIKKGDAYYKDKEFDSIEDAKKFIDSQLNESKNITANIYDKEDNILEIRHFSSRKQLDDYVNTLDNLIDMTADKELYKNKNGELETQDIWKIVIDRNLNEAKNSNLSYFACIDHFNPDDINYFRCKSKRECDKIYDNFDVVEDITHLHGLCLIEHNDESLFITELGHNNIDEFKKELIDELNKLPKEVIEDAQEWGDPIELDKITIYGAENARNTEEIVDAYLNWMDSTYVDSDSSSEFELIDIDEAKSNSYDFDISMTESKKKKEQGWFVKYNSGNPEENQAIFNKNMTINTSSDGEGQGLGEAVKTEPINFRKELKRLDLEKEEFGELSDLYDYLEYDLSFRDKIQLAALIKIGDYEPILTFLNKKMEEQERKDNMDVIDLDTIYKKDDLLDEDFYDDWDEEDNLKATPCSIVDELDQILSNSNNGSIETSDEDIKYQIIDELEKRDYKYEVSKNDLANKYHIEYWK